MAPVDMHDAKTRLSAPIEAVERGEETEIAIARDGRPAAVAAEPDVSKRIGIAKGRFRVPDTIDHHEAEITASFANDGKP